MRDEWPVIIYCAGCGEVIPRGAVVHETAEHECYCKECADGYEIDNLWEV